jgi:LVIVD repeat-containing protein
MSMLTRRSGAAVAVAALGAWLVAVPVAEMSSIAVLGLLLFAGPSAEAREGAKRLQGQVPLKDQLSGRALRGYKQHVRLVGHNNIQNRLQNGNLGWLDDCAYVAAYYGGSHPTAGLAVLNVADPRNPQLVRILPGVPGTRESQVEGNQDSRMVVVMPFPSATPPGFPFSAPESDASLLQIYDVPGDCTNLVRRGTYNFGKENGETIHTHEHLIWRDKIYVTVTSAPAPGPAISVVDASNRDNPVLLTTWDLSDEPGMPESAVHDLDVSPDGTRAYVNIIRTAQSADGGLAILDTSEVANWRPGMPRPTIRRISRILYWGPPMAGASHSAQLVKIKGRKYVLTENEGTGGSVGGCPAGWAQILDVNAEMNPTVISSFRLEANKHENCPLTLPDHEGVPTTGPVSILQGTKYNSHYLGVDNPEEARFAAFTWYSSGLRIVDISDPYSPKEVGYFMPPAINTGGPRSFPDRAYSFVRFHEGNIWFNSINGGFWVVRYTGDRDDDDDD